MFRLIYSPIDSMPLGIWARTVLCAVIFVFGSVFAADILFVLDQDTPNLGDDPVAQRLTSLALNVNSVDDDDLLLSHLDGQDLIVISSSAEKEGLGTLLRNTTLPILTWNTNVFAELGLLSGDTGKLVFETQIQIQQPGNPSANGLPAGIHSFLYFPNEIAWAEPFPDAVIIASLTTDTNRAVVFEYEPGDALDSGTAQGYRVGCYLQNETAFYWLPTAEAQFDAMISYILDVAEPAPNPPPTRSAAVTRLLPKSEPLGPSSRGTALVISEIMYHPREAGGVTPELEFVEITNTDPFTIPLGGLQLSGEVRYTFEEGAALGPFARVVVAQNPSALAIETGLSGILGPWEGRLANEGGALRLEGSDGSVLLEVLYHDLPPWPAAADGGGASLELNRPSYGEGDVRAWRASSTVGGSPGAGGTVTNTPFDYLRINEVLVHTDLPDIDYVELVNLHTQAVALAGLVLTDQPESNRYVFAPGQNLEPGGHLVLDQIALGFNLNGMGEKVFLLQTAGVERVLDAVAWPAQERGIAFGRTPDGSSAFRELSAPTPGAGNAGPKIHDIVINELMYHPLDGDKAFEYVEILNQGTQEVNLVNWQLSGGVAYVFPSGSMLLPGDFLVVGRDIDALVARYPQLNTGNTQGNYSGALSDGGETIRLLKPDDPSFPDQDFVEIDRVRYWDGGRWPSSADGGGSSLELVRAEADNLYPNAWAASEEASGAIWQTFEVSGLLDDLSDFDVTPDEVQLILMEEGECLVSEVEVLTSNGVNRVPAGAFSTNASAWTATGNHITSRLEEWNGSNVLHLVSSGDGDNGANSVECDLTEALVEGAAVTLRLRARWVSGMPRLLLRLRGNMFELSARLPTPEQPGTPGLANSTLQTNVGPCIATLMTSPVLPVAGEDVVVEAIVTDGDGVDAVTLFYREDGGSFSVVSMNDTGVLPDLHANDGRYAATLPGFGRDDLVEYYVEASDLSSNPRTSRFPDQAPVDNALLRFNHQIHTGEFHTVSLWMTNTNLQHWTQRRVLSNALVPGTLVLGDYRVIHGSGARYRGSPFIRRTYTSPTGFSPYSAYVIRAPDDDPYLGTSAINIDSLEQPDRDDTLQRERMAFWVARELGLPAPHQRYIRMMVNGARRGQLYADTQQPNRDFLRQNFPGETKGAFYEADNWFEFNDDESNLLAGDRSARMEDYRDINGERPVRRYRWSWERKDTLGILEDDFEGLFELVDVFSVSGASNYVERVRDLVSLDHWIGPIAVRRMVGDWDGYGYARGKNVFLYRPPGREWRLLLWDFDFSLGGGSRTYDHPLFEEIEDPTVQNLFAIPRFGREYWRQLLALTSIMHPDRFNPVSDEIHEALIRNGVSVTDPATASGLQDWADQRRAFVLASLSVADAPFAITSNGGFDFITASSPVLLSGTAPFEMENLLVNGVETEVRWLGSNTWQIALPLVSGTNVLHVGGTDEWGNILSSLQDSISVQYIGANPLQPFPLKLTELMYHAPEGKTFDFLELKNVGDAAVDLGGVRVTDDGQDFFIFGAGTILASGSHVVLATDSASFSSLYPQVSVHGDLPFNLSNGGETITVLNPLNAVITEVAFDDIPPWPLEADGYGYSLVPVLANPANDQNDATEWTWSCAVGGSPGEDDPGSPLRIPQWIIQPEDHSVALGEGAFFEVFADACPHVLYQWWRDGNSVSGEREEVLNLPEVGPLDHGSQLWCVASNSFGILTSQVATLTVGNPGTPPALPPVAVGISGIEFGVFSIDWPSVSNAIYRLQWTEDLDPADWRNHGSSVWGEGIPLQMLFTNSVLPRAFFRALQVSQP